MGVAVMGRGLVSTGRTLVVWLIHRWIWDLDWAGRGCTMTIVMASSWSCSMGFSLGAGRDSRGVEGVREGDVERED